MSRREIATVAARTLRRRLAQPRADDHGAERPAPEVGADDARLDTLRGELVHELDRLAAADQGCSAGFRRI